jgi:hypothetical protein
MAENFSEFVNIATSQGGTPVITLNAVTGDISAGGSGRDGDLVLRDADGTGRIYIDAASGTILIKDQNGRDAVKLDAGFGLLDLGAQGNEGDLRILDNTGRFVFRFDASNAVLDLGAPGNEGDLRVYNNDGEVTIHLDGNAGDIKLIGADITEDFSSASGIEPGSVVVAVGSDEIEVSSSPYDRRVIGVVAGGGGLHAGLRLGTRPGLGRVPVAMMGRVYCKADAAQGQITFGDLLTTSARPGHAMRIDDPACAAGAIMGKSLGNLHDGAGFIPVLLTLG